MHVTITGGCGFIGGHVAEYFAAHGFSVVVIDDLSTGIKANLTVPGTMIEADILNAEALDRAIAGADYVVHLAAFLSVPASFTEYQQCFRVNVDGAYQVLTACVRHRVKRVVFASSSAVYAGQPEIPKVESECPQPQSPYGISKLEGEHLLNLFGQHYQLPWTALRFFNVYGPRQSPFSDYAAVIPSFINNVLSGKPLTIFGDGEQTRDFVWVKDVARAIYLAAIGAGASGVYNVASGTSISINQLADATITLSAVPIVKIHAPPRPGDIRSSLADIGKIRAHLGWQPSIVVADGVKMTFDWFRGRKGN